MSKRTLNGVPTVDLDPYDPVILADPADFHEQLREAGPVVWLSRYEVYASGRFDQVQAALRMHEELISSAGVGLPDLRVAEFWRPPSVILEADRPEHTPRRAVLNRVLSPRALKKVWEPFAAAADRLVDQLLERRTFDAVTDLAEIFPLIVFPELVGLNDEVRPHLLAYGDLAFNSGGPRNDLMKAALERSTDAVAAVMAQTERTELRTDGIGSQIWSAVDGGGVTEAEAAQLIRSLLAAGVDTTVAGISAAIYGLAAHPDQWQLLKSEPNRARAAFEEAIRWESPAQTFYRTAARDADLGGVTVPAGARVALSLASANHDPRRFENPDVYDINRGIAGGHVGFGFGIHQCAGQHLGRLEGEAILSALARKVDVLELTGTPARRLNNTLRSWGLLPMAVTAAR